MALTTKAVRCVAGVSNQIGYARNVVEARTRNNVNALSDKTKYNILWLMLNTGLIQGCTACQCSKAGARNSICSNESGQCACLPGVVGINCACADGADLTG